MHLCSACNRRTINFYMMMMMMIPYHSPKLHPGPCNSVGMRPRTDRQTDRHTDARDHNTFRVVYDSREM